MSQAGKGHVPEENLPEYRRLASIARQYKTLAEAVSKLNELGEASRLFQASRFYWYRANELRVDL